MKTKLKLLGDIGWKGDLELAVVEVLIDIRDQLVEYNKAYREAVENISNIKCIKEK